MSNAYAVCRRPLCEYVDFFWQSNAYMQPHALERVLPTGTVDLVIDLLAPARSVASGIQTASFLLDTSGPLTLFGIRLKAGGAAGILGVPAIELQKQTVSLNDVWPLVAEELIEPLATLHPLARFYFVEQFLLRRISNSCPADPAIRGAAELWQSSFASVSVQSMADRLGFGVKRFSQRFAAQVGIAPKSYTRIMRFRNSLGILSKMADPDWVEVAVRAGYYDQSHFNHDFCQMAGSTPTAYWARRTAHPNHVRAVD
jgi:AraC-like DNA-binding protein